MSYNKQDNNTTILLYDYIVYSIVVVYNLTTNTIQMAVAVPRNPVIPNIEQQIQPANYIPRPDDLAAGIAASLAGRQPQQDEESSEDEEAAFYQRVSKTNISDDTQRRNEGLIKLTEESPRYLGELQKIKIHLYPHQLADLHELVTREKEGMLRFSVPNTNNKTIIFKTNVSIIGSACGAGKTLLVLALISLQHEIYPEKVMRSISLGSAGVLYEEVPHVQYSNCTLLIVPQRLVKHWIVEIEDRTHLKYLLYKPGVLLTWQDIRGVDVVISTPTSYLLCDRVIWKRVVVDEADTVKLGGKEILKYGHIHLITASYEGLASKRTGWVNGKLLKEFVDYKPTKLGHGLVTHARKAPRFPILNRLVVSCDADFIKASTKIPDYTEEVILCTTPGLLKASRQFISDEVAEMIASGDIEKAIVALGGKSGTGDNVMSLIRKNVEKDIHNERVSLYAIEQQEIEEREKIERIKRSKEKLASLESRLVSICNNIKNVGTNECAICYDVLQAPTMLLCCHNTFCGKCIIEWFNRYLHNKCPLCNKKVDMKKEVVTITQENIQENSIQKGVPLKKVQCLEKICNNKDRVLIFANHQGSLDYIGSFLRDAGIDSDVFYGTNSNVTTKFKNNRLKTLICDPKTTAGIALTDTDVLVLFHRMDPSLERQAIGRAHRVGRSKPLRVIRLYYECEMQKK